MSDPQRIILFKSPSADPYAQALLTAIGLPPFTRLRLTTYSARWVPAEVFKQPEKLDGMTALLVCADTLREPPTLKGTYPVRELTILRSRQLGEHLELVVETGGYVICPDYRAYLSELVRSHSVLPPQEHGFIVYDYLRDLQVVPPEDISQSVKAWQKSVEALVNVDALSRAVFLCASQVSHEPDGKTIRPRPLKPDSLKADSCSYPLKEYSRYCIELVSMLPRHTERGFPAYLELQVEYPDWAIGKHSIDVCGRSQRYPIAFDTRTSASGSRPSSIIIRPRESAFVKSPRLELFFDMKRSIRARARRRMPKLVAALVLALMYFWGQLAQSMKVIPSTSTLIAPSTELVGAFVSTVGLVLLTSLISTMIGSER